MRGHDFKNGKMLTLKNLKEMNPGIFAYGMVVDNVEGVNIGNTGRVLKWVAVRGQIHDWAIYIDNPHSLQQNYIQVSKYGDKIYTESHVRRLVDCDDEMFARYRW